MEGRLLLKGCTLLGANGRLRSGLSVLVDGGKISQVAPQAELPTRPGDWEVACRGRLLAPGLTDCHAHLVGSQLFPLVAEGPGRWTMHRRERQSILEGSLSVAEVEALTAFAAARALRNGVTLVAEHLCAPLEIDAALSIQARAANALGLRLINSHATSPSHSAREHFEQNCAYAKRSKNAPLVRGALGLDCPSSFEDDALEFAARLGQDAGLGVHYHLAATQEDSAENLSRFGRKIAARLESFGLLGPGCVGSYATAVDVQEAELLANTRALIAVSPRHSRLVQPAAQGLEAILSRQAHLGFGSGRSFTLWEEVQAGWDELLRLARSGRPIDPNAALLQLLFRGPSELCEKEFGASCGAITEGALADLVLYELVPHLGAGEFFPLLALASAPVAWSVVAGRVVVREGQLVGADYVELATEAARALTAISARGAAS